MLGVPRALLPEVRASNEVYGEVAAGLGLREQMSAEAVMQVGKRQFARVKVV